MNHNYSFAVLNYLFWNELTFLVTYDVTVNVLSKAAYFRYFSKEVFLNMLQYSQEEYSQVLVHKSTFIRMKKLLKKLEMAVSLEKTQQ